ncbi:jerky protein homolog, partial [Bombus pyrosoma]|uniref:jerky protein homolog n=1 Tax=Bombus pyrosoma TaxID=396416 RepID=UPI001CB9B37A
MAENRKPKTLTIEQKYEILQMLERGQTRRIVAEKYNISSASVSYIYLHRKEIKEYFETNPVITSCVTQRLTLSQSVNLDRVLYQWCIRCMKNNVGITGVEIQKKALELNEKLNRDSYFKAGESWLQNFRNRHHISHTDVRQDFPIPTTAAADTFKVDFNTLLQNEGYTLENVYNANYTAIMWKAVPKETLTFRHAKSTSSQKMCEDHVTTLFCANATGCHKLPVL